MVTFLLSVVSQKSIESWNKVFLLTAGIDVFSGILFFIFGDSRVQPWNYENCKEEEKDEKETHQNNLLHVNDTENKF